MHRFLLPHLLCTLRPYEGDAAAVASLLNDLKAPPPLSARYGSGPVNGPKLSAADIRARRAVLVKAFSSAALGALSSAVWHRLGLLADIR